METIAHQGLKRLAIAHLKAIGCAAFATEVKCPISRYRVDVAGYSDTGKVRRGQVASGQLPVVNPGAGTCQLPTDTSPFTVVIECKQCRADFLRDCESIEPLLGRRDELERMRVSIESHRIPRVEPHLRR